MNYQEPNHDRRESPTHQRLEAASGRDALVERAMRFVLSVIPENTPVTSNTIPFSTQPEVRVDGRTAASTGALIMNRPPEAVSPAANQEDMAAEARRAIDAI